jgi:hypothetical protein
MLKTGKDRLIDLVVFLAREEEAPAVTSKILRKQGTVWEREIALTQIERREIERVAGGRAGDMEYEALSAGFTAACFAFQAGASSVTLEGFSWGPGYAYLPTFKPEARGHLGPDRKALANLLGRYDGRFTTTLEPSRFLLRRAKERYSMATKPRPAAPAATSKGPAAASDKPARPMMVRATRMGFYKLARRRVGDVFELRSAKEFSKRWMEEVPDDTPPQLTSPRAAMHQANREAAKQTTTPRLAPNAADVLENRTLVQQTGFPAGTSPLEDGPEQL